MPCKICGGDIEETYTIRTCQGCGQEELECECLPKEKGYK